VNNISVSERSQGRSALSDTQYLPAIPRVYDCRPVLETRTKEKENREVRR
jgi:hypothetical protein